MPDEYICPKCSEKLGRDARHKPGSQIYADHMKFIKPASSSSFIKVQDHDEVRRGNQALMPDVIIDESDAIPDDLIKDVMENNFDIEEKQRDGKSIFIIKPNSPYSMDSFPLGEIPPNKTWIQTTEGTMQVVRDGLGKVVGLFDPLWSTEKINFRMEYWGWYIPDPNEFECKKFVTRPFTEIEKLKYAETIALFKHKKYSWVQKIKDAKKLKELLVKKNAKPI